MPWINNVRQKGMETLVEFFFKKRHLIVADKKVNNIAVFIQMPEALVISGSSAGGFATSLLSDDIITNYFPDTENITACVDSSLLYYDGWRETAVNIWKAPEEISGKLEFPSAWRAAMTGRLTGSIRDTMRKISLNSAISWKKQVLITG